MKTQSRRHQLEAKILKQHSIARICGIESRSTDSIFFMVQFSLSYMHSHPNRGLHFHKRKMRLNYPFVYVEVTYVTYSHRNAENMTCFWQPIATSHKYRLYPNHSQHPMAA